LFIITRLRSQNQILANFIMNHLGTYPTNTTLNYGWSFGSLLGLCLLMQIITGLILSMFYIPNVELAFYSVERIMRDIENGWLLRYMHSNGASFFFILLYLHMFKAILIKSYGGSTIKLWLWYSGVAIFFLSIATAFMGYVLPWGQMSFWAATVITNLFTAVPIIGNSIAYTLWGGFSVSNNTLNRFYTLHFILPFAICFLVFIYLCGFCLFVLCFFFVLSWLLVRCFFFAYLFSLFFIFVWVVI